ncbi:MAG: hypothetical protein J2P50_17790 [Hyphomicrobiaceae bacterium]|nr:hypothetical protein [Hyphomicrobiaceae bacterium]
MSLRPAMCTAAASTPPAAPTMRKGSAMVEWTIAKAEPAELEKLDAEL